MVRVDQLIAINGADYSTILLTGGALSLGASTIDTGSALTVGDGVQPAELHLLGGSHSSAFGYVVNTNATLAVGGSGVIGAATVTGDVTLREDARLAWDFNASTQDSLTIDGTVELPDYRRVVDTFRVLRYQWRMSACLELSPRRRPNVIWVFGDQHRAQALGYRGDPNVRTPAIDSMAREGMRFDAAVSGAPWCSPFRGSLLTGRYPHQCGVVRTPQALDPDVPTIAAPFRAAGYHTAYIGKWHLGGSNAVTHYIPPDARGGFDHWVGYENNNNQNECYVYGGGDETPRRLPGYETDCLTDLFIEHVEGRLARQDADGGYTPFFAVLSVQPPHNPYVPPTSPAVAPSGRNPASIVFRPNVPRVPWVREQAALDLDGYYGMVENLDWNIGRLRAALKRLDIDRETWLVFFSDHGDMLGSHGQWHKSSPWEESIRIPFVVVRGGGGRRMRTGRCDAPINHVDIAPTTLGLCGLAVPDNMVGHDYANRCLHPEDRNERDAPDDAREPDSAFLQQIPRKLHPHSVNKAWRGVLMRDGWKYVCTPGNDWLLHHTVDDPYEQVNLAHDAYFGEQRLRCLRRLQRWIKDTGDDFPLPPEA